MIGLIHASKRKISRFVSVQSTSQCRVILHLQLMYTLENLDELRKNPAEPVRQLKASWGKLVKHFHR